MRNTAATDTRKWDTVVEMVNVVKYFDQVRPLGLFKREKARIYALNDVSLSLKKGDLCAYAGPNGAGKSTTFKLLSGMLKPQNGQVLAFGRDPSDGRIAMMRKTGVLFGNRSELWWDHPVRATFEWKKKVWDISDDMYKSNIIMLTELLGLDEIWLSYARELSLGQRMRANLALTFLHSPELVLLDEPTLGLDVLAKRQMINFLKRINAEQGVTMLITSHDMDDLTEMARRIVLINRGKLAFDGDYGELLNLTGDRRVVKLIAPSGAPELPGAEITERDGARYTYEYNAARTSPEDIFSALARIRGVSDVELAHAPIESVIAGLYVKWQGEAAH